MYIYVYIYIYIFAHTHINTYICTYPVPIRSLSSDKKCAEILSPTNIVCVFVSLYLSLFRALCVQDTIYHACIMSDVIHCTISNSLR